MKDKESKEASEKGGEEGEEGGVGSREEGQTERETMDKK